MVMNMSKGRLGAQVLSMSDDLRAYFKAPVGTGILVDRVEQGSAAQKAGLKTGDVILEVDGDSISEPTQVSQALSDRKKNDQVKVLVLRKGNTKALSVTMQDDPGPMVHSFGPRGGFNIPDFDFDFEPFFRGGPGMGQGGMDKLQKRLERLEKRLQKRQKSREKQLEERIRRLEKELKKGGNSA
jgi:C-terminal processing protease CtpA/Prc